MVKIFFGAVLVMLSGSLLSTHNPLPPIPVTYSIDTVATNLQVPWDIVFMPDGEMLFTERPGRVRIMRDGVLDPSPVFTVPGIEVRGKMGLLGMTLHPSFTGNHFIYLAYNYRRDDKTWLRIARYVYASGTLTDPLVLIEQIPAAFNHTGCRLLFGKDRKLYVTTGDADVPVLAQDLKALNGKILRLNDDGSIPADNPFVRIDTARKEIWSYGHRNSQGIAFQPNTNYLFDSEHGPTGGDEINAVAKGNNYGWPFTHHRDLKQGTIAPLMEFSPSIGPAEAIFYSGKAFPDMKDNLLVSCMRGEAIMRIVFANGKIISYGYLFQKKYGRIRALAEAPDGSLYFSTSQVDPPESNMKTGDHDVDLILRMRPSPRINDTSGLQAPLLKEAINDFRPRPGSGGDHTLNVYMQLCAGCHGEKLEGIAETRSLLGNNIRHGVTRTALMKSISLGITDHGMPAWQGVLTEAETGALADFITKGRVTYSSKKK